MYTLIICIHRFLFLPISQSFLSDIFFHPKKHDMKVWWNHPGPSYQLSGVRTWGIIKLLRQTMGLKFYDIISSYCWSGKVIGKGKIIIRKLIFWHLVSSWKEKSKLLIKIFKFYIFFLFYPHVFPFPSLITFWFQMRHKVTYNTIIAYINNLT